MGNSTSQFHTKDPNFAKFVHFSQIEVKEWSNTFKSLYPTGKMNCKDFEDLYAKFFPLGKVQNFCQQLFKSIDIARTNFVDINELLIAFTILWKGSPFERNRWVFRFYDLDNDGFVSKEDLEIGLSNINEMISSSVFTEVETRKLVEKVFEMVQNKSGFLTLNDFEIIESKLPGKLFTTL